jgi:hypothetical protein
MRHAWLWVNCWFQMTSAIQFGIAFSLRVSDWPFNVWKKSNSWNRQSRSVWIVWRLSDSYEIVVKLIDHFDVENNTESDNRLKSENEFEKLMNLKHSCVIEPFGFVISSTWTELKIMHTYTQIGSLEVVLQTSPSWWTMTTKSIAIVVIVLGMRFIYSFGLS